MVIRTILLILALFLTVSCDNKKSERYKPIGEVAVKEVYKIGVHPYLNSQKMFSAYQPILNYLERHFEGVNFVLETSEYYSVYDEKLYNREFHFSLPNPFQTYNSLSYGYRVIGKMKPDSVFRGIFVARKDRDIKKVQQLKGQVISFPAPTALAATMMPLYYLHERGIDTEKDIEKRFVGSQYSSIMNAYSSDAVVGATWPPPWIAWSKENPEMAKEMEVVWETKPLINNGFVVRDDIDETFAGRVIELLINLNKSEEGRRVLENAGFAGFERADNSRYSVVGDFLIRYDKVIGIPKWEIFGANIQIVLRLD